MAQDLESCEFRGELGDFEGDFGQLFSLFWRLFVDFLGDGGFLWDLLGPSFVELGSVGYGSSFD